MRVLILHDHVGPEAPPDASDALVQAELIRDHLTELGHGVRTRGVTLDLGETFSAVCASDLVINLVESLAGRGSLIHLVPAIVEAAGVPMTGCPAEAIATTSNKIAAKRLMRVHGVPTPDWVEPGGASPRAGRWIVKSVWEHASIGLGPGSIVDASGEDVLSRMDASLEALGGHAMAEAFIDGREFNLSVLEIDGEPRVLPVAEIRFEGYGEDRPRIVDYAAKWDASSHAYHHTPRSFAFGSEDAGLLELLRSLARRCWGVFGLRGYARVDFRVDGDGRPWVLEVNTNPCLSPDAGFLAAAGEAGLAPGAVADHLVRGAMRTGRATRSAGVC